MVGEGSEHVAVTRQVDFIKVLGKGLPFHSDAVSTLIVIDLAVTKRTCCKGPMRRALIGIDDNWQDQSAVTRIGVKQANRKKQHEQSA